MSGRNDEKLSFISMTCPSCGGTMKLAAGQDRIVCQYCGREVLIEKRNSAKEAYERQLAREKAAADFRERQVKKGRHLVVRIYLGIAAFFAIVILVNALIPGTELHEVFFPVKADPYQNIVVSFSGDSGRGRAHVTNHNAKELGSVRFTITPDDELENGDIITVKADRLTGYRWEPAEMTLEVTGLTEWILDPEQIPAGELEKLHANTARLIREEWDAIVKTDDKISYKLEPYRLYLFVEKDPDLYDRNYLYDSFAVTVTKADGTQMTNYQACRYKNIKLPSSGGIIAEYGSLMGFNLGYMQGFSYTTSFSGWLDANEMEADLRAVRDSCVGIFSSLPEGS